MPPVPIEGKSSRYQAARSASVAPGRAHGPSRLGPPSGRGKRPAEPSSSTALASAFSSGGLMADSSSTRVNSAGRYVRKSLGSKRGPSSDSALIARYTERITASSGLAARPDGPAAAKAAAQAARDRIRKTWIRKRRLIWAPPESSALGIVVQRAFARTSTLDAAYRTWHFQKAETATLDQPCVAYSCR